TTHFVRSNTTEVSISANTEVNGITFTSAATNPYIVTVNPHVTLTLGGTGDYEQLRRCTDSPHYAVIRVYDDVGNANRGRLGYKQERPSQRNGHSCSGKLSRG